MRGIPDLAEVEAMDAADPLRAMRDRFVLPEGVIYLDGNSLGAASVNVFSEIETAAKQEWAQDLIRAWNTARWFDMPVELGDRLGRLIGAALGQTVVCDDLDQHLQGPACGARNATPTLGHRCRRR